MEGRGPHNLQGGLPLHPTQGQVRPPTLPSQRLPIGHCLPQSPRRGQGLEASHHHQATAVSDCSFSN